MIGNIIVVVMLVALYILVRAIRRERKLRAMLTREGRHSFESDKVRTGSFLHRAERGR